MAYHVCIVSIVHVRVAITQSGEPSGSDVHRRHAAGSPIFAMSLEGSFTREGWPSVDTQIRRRIRVSTEA